MCTYTTVIISLHLIRYYLLHEFIYQYRANDVVYVLIDDLVAWVRPVVSQIRRWVVPWCADNEVFATDNRPSNAGKTQATQLATY